MAEKLNKNPASTFDFGPFAGEYEDWYATPEGKAHDLVQQKDILALLADVPRHGRLLEVGCGTGHWSRFFWSLGFEVHGIDVSEEMISEAKRTVPQCSFGRGNAQVLPAPDGSYDIVASVAALEFIPDPDAAVREMARCTRP
ncbi:MAG: class I SAM-dependent methyltransferase, partial [Proteobacteria bacterium]|nr:class I SAM-dependent methyltransferase [Pseudomonadota bacterium]